ncbi:MAG: DUF3618 domain-containing protein [Actinomycetota bacterium]
MGENSAATVREIEQTRERLEEELTELQDRLPAPAVWAKRAAGVAASGGAAATIALFVIRRRRRKREAEEAARLAPMNAVIQVLPEDWADRVRAGLEDGRWKPWVAGAAGLYVAFRLAEIRQLRKMNKALVASR